MTGASLIKTGQTFGLNGSTLDWPNPHVSRSRPPAEHHVYDVSPKYALGDYLDSYYFHTGTHWDGFLHIRDIETGEFYNGNTDRSIGVESWATAGIVGRGVLLDVERWTASQGRPIDWRSRSEISASDLKACAESQEVSIGEGTIVLMRVGWQTGYGKLDYEERVEYSYRPELVHPGLAANHEVAELLWDWGVAAVASDTPAFEAKPYLVEVPDRLHTLLLVRLGMPIGEYFLLDELAIACEQAGRYEFFLTSAPINVRGGTGTPANALAIL